MVRLQVALDVVSLEKAINVASRVAELCEHRHLIFEAGTPLIKSEGILAVRRLSYLFENIPVVADMKTADVGELEAELAIKNGAQYTTVLALASDETISAVVRTAHALGGKTIADLMNVENLISRAIRLDELGVDVLCYHVPIDVQAAGKLDRRVVTRMIAEIKNSVKAKVAVAGGVNVETARLYADAGADILVVGRYIYAAADPGKAAKDILLNVV
ncbi:MAG: orotidine 5'-phosphate decarboxylase [Thermofilaceae archaeon]|nr:orotidine 5'-phosphate decarboxylase [Thermofilaceae archaeon]MDW8004476.1 orotidine 5'-phosphate decarboxylase / HUMPS family protein [Thermofilaceae archaeon]